MAGYNNLELEIYSLFQDGYTLEQICQDVVIRYEKSEAISSPEIESLSHFLISAGQYELLFKLYNRCLRRDSLAAFPWGYFTLAIEKNLPQIPDLLLDIMVQGIESEPSESSCAKNQLLLQSIPIVSSRLKLESEKFQLEQLENKARLIDQLNQNRLYQLVDQEEQTLQQLVKSYPRDIEVQLLYQAHLEKKADDILLKVKNQAFAKVRKQKHDISEYTPEGQEALTQISQHLQSLSDQLTESAPEQIYNLAIVAMHFELYDLGLSIIEKAPKTFSSEWLKAEILFESGRHLDLLKHIEEIETRLATTPEATYGATYLKAQAYYGLGQKDIAIQLLESLSQAVPSYRSTEALLHEWKNQ